MNNLYYPECHIPKKLFNYFNGATDDLVKKYQPRFEYPKLKPVCPENVIKPELREIFGLLPFTVNFVISLFFFPSLYFWISSFFLLVVTIAILGSFYLYPSRKRRYEFLLNLYQKDILEFSMAEQEFQQKLATYQSSVKSFGYLWNLIVDEMKSDFSNSPTADREWKASKGQTENNFRSKLISVFGTAIRIDRTIEVFSYRTRNKDYNSDYDDYDERYISVRNAYVPDFCFIHPKNLIKIDIEIDEPYCSYTELLPMDYYSYDLANPEKKWKPIHCVNDDQKRNQHFLDKNWVVLRFSEQQIKLHPDECCREIAEIIYDLTDDEEYLTTQRYIKRLPRTKKWTYKEAEELIENRVRDKYISLRSNTINISHLNGTWNSSDSSFTFDGNTVTWNHQPIETGFFLVRKDLYGRYIMEIFWGTDPFSQFVIIDHLDDEALQMTFKHSRLTSVLTRVSKGTGIKLPVIYDQSQENLYSIEQIKSLFGYAELPLKRAVYKNKQPTDFLYFLDSDTNILLVIGEKLVEKIKQDRSYNQIKLHDAIFYQFAERNRITFRLTDVTP